MYRFPNAPVTAPFPIKVGTQFFTFGINLKTQSNEGIDLNIPLAWPLGIVKSVDRFTSREAASNFGR